jgi:hypothetical protein
MQRSGSFQHPFGSSDLDIKPSFNVVIAYEDFDTGKSARRTYDYLSHHLGPDCQFNNEMWKFDVLGIPRLREVAAKDVRTADIIIISCHGAAPLPQELKSWIELWLSEEPTSIALVALLDSSAEISPRAKEILDYLADVAKRGNMEFFAQPDRWPDRNQLTGSLQLLPPRAANRREEKPLSPLTRFNYRVDGFPHWGINE